MSRLDIDMDPTVCQETYGTQPVRRHYLRKPDGSLQLVDETPQYSSVSDFFRSVFLPQGYPDSVSDDYLTYQIWDTVQAFASSITGTLATQAVLKGVGVGDESATAMAATITWLMKDGTGHVGRIAFAWLQGTNLDCDAKRWRFFADILNDFAICVDILAPHFKQFFTAIMCLSSVCRSIVGVAGGATRAALTQHQARRNNMADVSAKDGSQETIVNLFGLICSLLIIPIVTGNQTLTWLLFVLFTSLHLYANYCAVTAVTMETFNQARLHLAVFDHLSAPSSDISGVKNVNQREPVLWSTKRLLQINLGTTLNKVLQNFDDLVNLRKIFSHSRYLLNVDFKKGCINIVLHRRSDSMDQLESCFHAEAIEYAYRSAGNVHMSRALLSSHIGGMINAIEKGDTTMLLATSTTFVKENFQMFLKGAAQEGWKHAPVYLAAEEWRARWDNH